MHLSFLIISIFLHQSIGFLFDGKPLFPPASGINNSTNAPLVQVTGGKGGKGGAGDIPGEDGASNLQIESIDVPHSMSMTKSDNKGHDVFMVMSQNQSTTKTPTPAPTLSDDNGTDVSNEHKILMINNDGNKAASLFMLPKLMLATRAGNHSYVEITGGNGAGASDGGKDGSVQVQVMKVKKN